MAYEQLKLENQLCFPLYAAAREVVKKYKPFLDEIGLTYTQYIAMMVLWDDESINVKSLGERLHLDSGTLTPLLKKLERDGLVIRSRSIADERNLEIRLTEAGSALKERAAGIPAGIVAYIALPAQDAAQLYALLHKLLDALRQ